MEDKELELRMYFLVPYNISDIQKSIQAGHSGLRYALRFGRYNPNHIIWDFIEKYETWIILNGGTTNDERDFEGFSKGSLNQIGDSLQDNDIEFSFFHEPDLNNALTALCIIVDERVFNKKDYPDFLNYLIQSLDEPCKLNGLYDYDDLILKNMNYRELIILFPDYYKSWVRSIGGVKNEFLRELLKDKKLA
jgi:hypothetical protein